MTTRINPALIGKFGLTHSVGSNALTLTLTHADGSTISASNPVYAEFPSATLSSALKSVVTITSPITVTVSSGSTLGHASGSLCSIFVYLILNGSTPELAVSNLPPDYPGTFLGVRLISTAAEGGAGAADSATGIYSTTARSNVPWIPVAFCRSTQTTAGTWASSLTQVDVWPYRIPTGLFHVRVSPMSLTNGAVTKVQMSTEDYDPDSVFDAATNYRHRPFVAGQYHYDLNVKLSGIINPLVQGILYIRKNGASDLGGSDEAYCAWQSGISPGSTHQRMMLMNGCDDYADFHVYQVDGAARNSTCVAVGHRIAGGGAW